MEVRWPRDHGLESLGVLVGFNGYLLHSSGKVLPVFCVREKRVLTAFLMPFIGYNFYLYSSLEYDKGNYIPYHLRSCHLDGSCLGQDLRHVINAYL